MHGGLNLVVRHIKSLVGRQAAAASSDGQLLRQFVETRDEAAFRTLLDRYGRLVLGVCQRVLGDHGRAEDAFQATFLILVRKAHALDDRASLAGWLCTVAQRVAYRARSAARRRQEYERRTAILPVDESTMSDDDAWELRAVLDEELARLPAKYREPLIQCYLLGRTNEEAARHLGWTKGTVSGRLARARDLLRALTQPNPGGNSFAAVASLQKP